MGTREWEDKASPEVKLKVEILIWSLRNEFAALCFAFFIVKCFAYF